MIAGGEALIIHRREEVSCVGVRGHRPRVSVCAQESPHEFIGTDRLDLQFDRAVQRFLDLDLGHDVGRVIRHVGLHQRWRQSDRLPIGCPLGDAPHKLEKLRSPNARDGTNEALIRFSCAIFAWK